MEFRVVLWQHLILGLEFRLQPVFGTKYRLKPGLQPVLTAGLGWVVVPWLYSREDRSFRIAPRPRLLFTAGF